MRADTRVTASTRCQKATAIAACALAAALLSGASVAAAPAAPAQAETAPDRRNVERRPAQAPVRQEAKANGAVATRTLDADTWQPGSPLRMVVSVAVPPGASVRLPAFDAGFGPFDVQAAPQPARQDGTVASAVTLVAWDAGALEVPAIDVAVTLADGTEAKLTLPAASIELTSLLGDDMPLTELASDIRGPVEIATGSWLWWAAAGAAAAGALAFTWWLRSMGAAPEAEPPLPPAEWALRELDRLESDALPARGEVEAFFVRLSDIVRTYVEGRFAIAAPDRTTQEFLREAAGHPELAGERSRELSRFLRTADMVKFAAARPPADACSGSMQSMRAFVEATAPREDATDQRDAVPGTLGEAAGANDAPLTLAPDSAHLRGESEARREASPR